MTVRQLIGDARVQLATLEAGAIQCCITSPPYYGLRSYGTPDLVWGGDPDHAHIFGAAIPGENRGGSGTFNGRNGRGENYGRDAARGQVCSCGAWLGSLGLEPDPAMYVEHIVECFRHVKRVLRDDGTLWVNLGDSYAGSGKGPSNSVQSDASQIGPSAIKKRNPAQFANGQAPTAWLSVPAGVKPKDLMMIPSRVAMALQTDGWYLRSVIPWLKRNSMPESVTDRPSTSVEYVFLLSKRERYFWDAAAVRVEQRGNSGWLKTGPGAVYNDAHNHNGQGASTLAQLNGAGGRNRRNSDWFFESWQGLMLDEQDDPLALVVNPQPFKESHFATFSPKLVEPMVKASTSERGQCPECGAPWVRVVEKGEPRNVSKGGMPRRASSSAVGPMDRNGSSQWDEGAAILVRDSTTIGWRPSCAHTADPVPCTIIDPFGGAGTVGLVADRLGRNAVLVDLKPEYSAMAVDRLAGDAPLFVEMRESPA